MSSNREMPPIPPQGSDNNNRSEPVASKMGEPKGPFQVVATRHGFMDQMRINPGDKFTIRKVSQFGEWMECLDPVAEKWRKQFFEQKKRNQKKETAGE